MITGNKSKRTRKSKRTHILTKVAKPQIVKEPTFIQKLDYLIEQQPGNQFYGSLKNQMKMRKTALSPKQLQRIEKNYQETLTSKNKEK